MSKISSGLLILLVTLATTGCGHQPKACVQRTVPELLLQQPPPLIEPVTDNDLDVLDAWIENARRTGMCYTAHATLAKAVRAAQETPE